MMKFFTSIGGFLLGSLLLAFLIVISFNPGFFAKVAMKQGVKRFSNTSHQFSR